MKNSSAHLLLSFVSFRFLFFRRAPAAPSRELDLSLSLILFFSLSLSCARFVLFRFVSLRFLDRLCPADGSAQRLALNRIFRGVSARENICN